MSRQSARLPYAVKVYWIATIALTAMALLFLCIQRYLLHWGYPYNTLLFVRQYRFSDFYIYTNRFTKLGQPDFFTSSGFPFTYPAPLVPVYAFFFRCFPSHPMRPFLASILGGCIVGTVILARNLRRAGTSRRTAALLAATILLTSYPFMVLLDRGNIEGDVWIVLSSGLIAVASGQFWIAAILIGIAGSMKFVPAIFLMLFLFQRRFAEFCLGVFSVIAATVVSLWWVGPTISIALTGVREGLERFAYMFVYRWGGWDLRFDHTLFGIWKTAMFYRGPHSHDVLHSDYIRHQYRIYFVVVALLVIPIFLRLRKMPPLNQMIGLAACAMVLPPFSVDYTLVHLYVPFALLLLYTVQHYQADKSEPIFLVRMFLYFAILFTPQSYLILGGQFLGGLIKVAALIGLLSECLIHPLDPEPEVARCSTSASQAANT